MRRLGMQWLAFLGLMGPVAAQDTASDEKLLRQAGVAASSEALLAFLRKQSPTDADRKQIAGLVQKLGSERFEERELASVELLQWQTAALDELRKGATHPDPEVARRCRDCLEQIENGPGPQLPAAAVRMLAQRKPAGTISALLDFVPHSRDFDVQDVVGDALITVIGQGPADPLLRAALTDAQPLRRAAAAYVLGRNQDAGQRAAVAPLLADRQAIVRFRAMQGLLAARDPAGVPALIELTLEPPGELAYRVDDLLQRLAGDRLPALTYGDTPEARLKRRDAWKTWWDAHGKTISLARIDEAPPFLGHTLVPEMHANKVWEYDRAGQVLWTLENLQCPIDAQVLPNGRVLIAELNGNRVTERDRKGTVLWEKQVATPIAVQRLLNGQTFIGTNHRLFIVGPDGKETWSYQAENGYFIHSVQRLRNGHFAMVSMSGKVREIDAQGKEVRSFLVQPQGSWSGIEGLAANRYLVVNNGQGKVLEIDAAGKTVWEHTQPGACYATRLPGGNTLIVNNRTGLIEVDRQGKVVAEKKMSTSVWRVHRR